MAMTLMIKLAIKLKLAKKLTIQKNVSDIQLLTANTSDILTKFRFQCSDNNE